MGLYIIMGFATAINIIVVLAKIKSEQYEAAGLDFAIFLLLVWLGGGTLGGMFTATVASCLVSIYLFFRPPTFLTQIFEG